MNGKTNGTAPTPGNSGISDGVAAGIGIGCAIVGAILAALIVFFLLRRKRGGEQFYGDGGGPSNGAAYSNGEKGPVVSATSVKGGAVTNIDRLLPLPAEDNEIIGGLSRIRDDIKNHVQNYYGNAAVRPEMIDEGRLRELAQATGISTPAIASLLLNPATRIPAIRLLIAQFVLSRCIGRTDGQPTFLPLEVSHLAGHPITAGRSAQNPIPKSPTNKIPRPSSNRTLQQMEDDLRRPAPTIQTETPDRQRRTNFQHQTSPHNSRSHPPNLHQSQYRPKRPPAKFRSYFKSRGAICVPHFHTAWIVRF